MIVKRVNQLFENRCDTSTWSIEYRVDQIEGFVAVAAVVNCVTLLCIASLASEAAGVSGAFLRNIATLIIAAWITGLTTRKRIDQKLRTMAIADEFSRASALGAEYSGWFQNALTISLLFGAPVFSAIVLYALNVR
ncbi:MAG: hypothetical protein AAAFM81_04525 [Pseudomonadota bacterium]